MKIPKEILAVILGAILSIHAGLTAWTLVEVVNLKVAVASIQTQLNHNQQKDLASK